MLRRIFKCNHLQLYQNAGLRYCAKSHVPEGAKHPVLRCASHSFTTSVVCSDKKEADTKSESPDASKTKKKKTLAEEIGRGYFGHVEEYHELKKKGNKLWMAASDLTDAKESKALPTISGDTLSGRKLASLQPELDNKISLVLVAVRDIARPQLELYRTYFEENFASHSATQVIEVSLIERLLFRYLSFLMISNLKKVISDLDRQDKCLVSNANTDVIVEQLDISNPLFGYAYLVDGRGRIRWRAHGTPAGEELVILKDLTEKLIKRQ